jgi:SagB-type dehydrogenase family enzyme
MYTSLEFELLLAECVKFVRTETGVHLAARGFNAEFVDPSATLVHGLECLATSGATESQLCDEVMNSGDQTVLFSLFGLLHFLDEGGCLQRQLRVDNCIFARLTPLTGPLHFDSEPLDADVPRFLSRFAYMHVENGILHLDSPLGRARVELHDPLGAAVIAALAKPHSTKDLCVKFPGLAEETLSSLFVLLQNASVFADEEESTPGLGKSPASWWEFHDLVFYMRSRLGRHENPYGGTLRLKHLSAPPLERKETGGKVIPLPRPDLERLRRTDRTLADVMEQRRSRRNYGDATIQFDQLSEFLYRAVRYQRVVVGDATDLAFRATPSGGALQELEIYPVVARCEGLEAGVYRYNPLQHNLTWIDAPQNQVARLLSQAWETANREPLLQLYFGITARCQRVFWKYEAMGYALILKNLGAFYATMYLAAEAMSLAACALGGGDAELFSRVIGADPYEEPAVGEFLLGSRGGHAS